MIKDKVKELLLSEVIEIKDITRKKGTKPCSIFLGRFQPPTKLHVQILQQAQAEHPLVLFIVKGKGTSEDKERNPFDAETQIKILKKSTKNSVKDIRIIPDGFIGTMVDSCRKTNLEPVILYAGSDRVKGYQQSIDRYKKEVGWNIKVVEIKRIENEDNVSATKLRNALIHNDYPTFLKMSANLDKSDFEYLRGQMKKAGVKVENFEPEMGKYTGAPSSTGQMASGLY